jgi:hypothetical protein
VDAEAALEALARLGLEVPEEGEPTAEAVAAEEGTILLPRGA